MPPQTSRSKNFASIDGLLMSKPPAKFSTTVSEYEHKNLRQWRSLFPVHLMLWADNQISTMTLGVKKAWLGTGQEVSFVVVLKQRKADMPCIWIQGLVLREGERKSLELVVSAQAKSETSSSYVTDIMKGYDLTIGDFFRVLLTFGFDYYNFAEPADGRHWIAKIQKFLLDRNKLSYLEPENVRLEICSPWWNDVQDGQFMGSPDVSPLWNEKQANERFEALKRCLAEAGI